MLELRIEQYLVARAAQRGGIALKHGVQGWPDRIVILPGGRIGWCELKRPGEQLRALQVARAQDLASRGVLCGMCDSLSSVDAFIEALLSSKGGRP